MEKQSRVSLNLRAAPSDAAEFTGQARSAGRSLGEHFALMLAKLRNLEATRPVSRRDGEEQSAVNQ